MIKYFSNIGYSCPSQSNPADYFVDLASIDIRNIKNAAKKTFTNIYF